jgi:uncharacterized coiled-coil protein SlyX
MVDNFTLHLLTRGRHMKAVRASLAAGLIAVMSASAGPMGCVSNQPFVDSGATLHAADDVAVTSEQARLRMRAMVHPMCGAIEQAADSIIAESGDRDVRLAALRWKSDAVPALREALYQPDPRTASVDTLVLCIQMRDFFETGPGRYDLGPGGSAVAVATCRRLEEEVTRVLASATISGDVSDVVAFSRNWAAGHPIRHAISDRPSVLSAVYEHGAPASLSAGVAVASVASSMDDMNRKSEVYGDQLFRQARWEAERMKLEVVSELRLDEAIPLAAQAAKSAERAVGTAERLEQEFPKLVAAERAAAVTAIRDEINRMHEFFREERVAALEQLTSERRIVVKEMNDTVGEQRREMTREADALTVRSIDYALNRAARFAGIGAAIVTAVALLAWLLARRTAGRQRPRRNMSVAVVHSTDFRSRNRMLRRSE